MEHVIEIDGQRAPRTSRGLLLAGLVTSRAVARMRLLSVRGLLRRNTPCTRLRRLTQWHAPHARRTATGAFVRTCEARCTPSRDSCRSSSTAASAPTGPTTSASARTRASRRARSAPWRPRSHTVGPLSPLGHTQWAHSLLCRPATGYLEAKRAWRRASSASHPHRSPRSPPGRLHEPCGTHSI